MPVAAGRAVPATSYTTAGVVAAERRELMAKFERQGIKATPTSPPPTGPA